MRLKAQDRREGTSSKRAAEVYSKTQQEQRRCTLTSTPEQTNGNRPPGQKHWQGELQFPNYS